MSDITYPGNRGSGSIFEAAAAVGQRHRTPGHIIALLTRLIAERGFPAPYPSLLGGVLTDAVHLRSRFDMGAVAAWEEAQVPTHLAPRITTAATERVGQILAARAQELAA